MENETSSSSVKEESYFQVIRKVTFATSLRKKSDYQDNVFDHQRVLHYVREMLGDKVMDFVSSYVNVDSAYVRTMYLVSPFNVATLPMKQYKGIVNACKMNQNHQINSTFEEVNHKLETGAYYVGCADTYANRKNRFKRKYGPLFYILAPMDFFYHRMMAKIKWTRKLYLKLTKGNKRVLSKTEVLGRLIRAGFEIVDFQEIDNTLWYVARKISTPDTRPAPDYGLLYKKRCIGKDGKVIEILKVRTMHPYAEYLQSYLIQNHGYSDKEDGKIKNDYRITRWGKVLRKLYLDEIPQLFSVLKGDMGLIGVRPVTQARLNEFPDDLVKARQQFKPGCIPPYVALRMGDELGNLKAEWIYIRAKEKQGVWADIRFLAKGVFNIVTGRMLSA